MPEASGAGPAPPAPPSAPSRGRGRVLIALITLVLVGAGAFLVYAVHYHDEHGSINDIRASGIPASVPTSLANLMALAALPNKAAPGFTLTDQNGRTLTLASFRGRSVVLEFMDSRCIDICPIVSQEFVDAYHDLGRSASRTVFAAVNVNQFHRAVADVAAYSTEHQLDTIPSWHFFTGPVSTLQAVWASYGVQVEAPSPSADIIHSSIVVFIDPKGRERFIASPMVDHTSHGRAYLPAVPLASWGQGISLVAKDLSS